MLQKHVCIAKPFAKRSLTLMRYFITTSLNYQNSEFKFIKPIINQKIQILLAIYYFYLKHTIVFKTLMTSTLKQIMPYINKSKLKKFKYKLLYNLSPILFFFLQILTVKLINCFINNISLLLKIFSYYFYAFIIYIKFLI